jgi:hypothetical protein
VPTLSLRLTALATGRSISFQGVGMSPEPSLRRRGPHSCRPLTTQCPHLTTHSSQYLFLWPPSNAMIQRNTTPARLTTTVPSEAPAPSTIKTSGSRAPRPGRGPASGVAQMTERTTSSRHTTTNGEARSARSWTPKTTCHGGTRPRSDTLPAAVVARSDCQVCATGRPSWRPTSQAHRAPRHQPHPTA